MSQKNCLIVYRVSGAVLLIALAGLIFQVSIVGTMSVAMTVLVSGVICLLAYKRSSDGGQTVDFAKMLDKPGVVNNKTGKIAQATPAGTVTAVSVIVGVVDGVGGSGDGKQWDAYVNLHPWRVKGGTAQDTDLTIRLPKPVSQSEYDRLTSDLSGDDVIVEVRTTEVTTNKADTSCMAQLVEIVSIGVADSELASIASQKILPVELVCDGNPVLFSMDEEEGTFVGKIAWLGKPICLYLDTDDSRQTKHYIKDANMLLASASSWKLKLQEKVGALLDEENRKLLRPEDRDKSPDAILARLSLNNIHIMEDGVFLFNFTEGDVFPDKEISVFGNFADGLDDADLF